RVGRVHGPFRDTDGERHLTRGVDRLLLEPRGQPAREAERVARAAGRHDQRKLLAADPTSNVAGADERGQRTGDGDEDLVADGVTADVVDALEIVDVEHEQGDRVVRA